MIQPLHHSFSICKSCVRCVYSCDMHSWRGVARLLLESFSTRQSLNGIKTCVSPTAILQMGNCICCNDLRSIINPATIAKTLLTGLFKNTEFCTWQISAGQATVCPWHLKRKTRRQVSKLLLRQSLLVRISLFVSSYCTVIIIK